MRIALFTQRALPLTTDVFTAFAGEVPDRQEDRPKEGIRRQVGKIENAELIATINPIMVDFVFAPLPLTAENLMGDLSSLSFGELKAELAKFERRILVWLPKWEVPTTRASLVIQARAAAASNEAAYEILRDNLSSVQVRPGEMSDFLFRVNWKAKTKAITEGYFNRLTSWSALNVKMTASSGSSNVGVQIQDRYYAQVEIDINTPAERTEPLLRDKINSIYNEFFQLAVKIAETGEAP
jgi:hypothetical protein